MIVAARARSPITALVAIILVSLLFHAVILSTVRFPYGLSLVGLFKLSFVSVSALSHWAIYVSLLTTFALTLRRGHTPLVTAMAGRFHGAVLSDEIIRYTRKVTIAWCLFFAAQLLTSVSLFLLAPLTVWSFFVNVMDIPLLVAMFAGEYACRLHVLKDPPRHSLAMIVQMVGDCMRQPPSAVASTVAPATAPPTGSPPR
jgi:uncharacterized membrane protein